MLTSTIRLAASGITTVVMLGGAITYRGDPWLKLFLLCNATGTAVINLLSSAEEEEELQRLYDRQDVETQARINRLTRTLVFEPEKVQDTTESERSLWLAINTMRSQGATESQVLALLHQDRDLARAKREALDRKFERES